MDPWQSGLSPGCQQELDTILLGAVSLISNGKQGLPKASTVVEALFSEELKWAASRINSEISLACRCRTTRDWEVPFCEGAGQNLWAADSPEETSIRLLMQCFFVLCPRGPGKAAQGQGCSGKHRWTHPFSRNRKTALSLYILVPQMTDTDIFFLSSLSYGVKFWPWFYGGGIYNTGTPMESAQDRLHLRSSKY